MTEVVVRIMGGLGNQLFQHAAALGYSDRPRYLIQSANTSRRPTIRDVLPTDLEEASALDRAVLGDVPKEWPRWRRMAVRRAGPLLRRSRPSVSIVQSASDEAFAPPPELHAPDRVYLDGYFLHPGFYEPKLPAVCRDLLERAPRRAGIGDGVVAVSFRRGDFVNEGWALGLAYYRSALAVVNADRADPVWVVSDDAVFAELATERLRADGFTVLPTPSFGLSTAMNDFWAAAFAERFVAANSTFAWWAGAVGDLVRGPDGHQVVIPKPWVFDDNDQMRRPHWSSAACD